MGGSTSTSSSEGQVMPKLGGQSMNRDTSHDCTGTHSADQYPTMQQDATDSVVATEKVEVRERTGTAHQAISHC